MAPTSPRHGKRGLVAEIPREQLTLNLIGYGSIRAHRDACFCKRNRLAYLAPAPKCTKLHGNTKPTDTRTDTDWGKNP
jgi:hypothetical protein